MYVNVMILLFGISTTILVRSVLKTILLMNQIYAGLVLQEVHINLLNYVIAVKKLIGIKSYLIVYAKKIINSIHMDTVMYAQKELKLLLMVRVVNVKINLLF